MKLNGKKYTTIYMSLYGISNLEEISKKIFMETSHLMNKNLRKYMESNGQTTIPEYAKTGIDMANFFGNATNGNKVDYSDFFSTDDKVLCFDDLERANVDVIDILGYINNFVEHDHIKTIIICNEKELSTKIKNSKDIQDTDENMARLQEFEKPKLQKQRIHKGLLQQALQDEQRQRPNCNGDCGAVDGQQLGRLVRASPAIRVNPKIES